MSSVIPVSNWAKYIDISKQGKRLLQDQDYADAFATYARAFKTAVDKFDGVFFPASSQVQVYNVGKYFEDLESLGSDLPVEVEDSLEDDEDFFEDEWEDEEDAELPEEEVAY